MATIYQAPPAQAPQPQFQVQQQQQQYPQDPLFDALVKYITQGPGPSAVSSAQIQSILDDHVDQRSYLESIVLPQTGGDIRIWKEHGMATGFISTNMGSLTLHLTVRKPGNMTNFIITFHGSATGFYPPQVYTFENCVFHWNELRNVTRATFTIEKVKGSFDNSYSILFNGGEVWIPENPPIAEITLSGTTLNLPDRPISGTGDLVAAE